MLFNVPTPFVCSKLTWTLNISLFILRVFFHFFDLNCNISNFDTYKIRRWCTILYSSKQVLNIESTRTTAFVCLHIQRVKSLNKWRVGTIMVCKHIILIYFLVTFLHTLLAPFQTLNDERYSYSYQSCENFSRNNIGPFE